MENSIFDLVTAPWKTAILNSAVRLKIFTVLSERRMRVEELTAQTGADEVYLQAVLNALVCMGLLHNQNGGYKNSHLSRIYFVEGEPYFMGDFIQLLINESSSWNNLFSMMSGGKEITDHPGDSHKTFIKAMHNMAMFGEVNALINCVDFSDCYNMVDAGGGSGIYSVSLCQKYPDLNCVILDRHETLAVTRELISKHKERERIELRECDITRDRLGDNIDAVLLSDVTYDDVEAGMILRNAWHCLRTNGRLVIRGYYFDPQSSTPLFGALFAMNQLVFDSSRKILTLPSLRDLIEESGYVVSKISPLTERSFLIIATKTAN